MKKRYFILFYAIFFIVNGCKKDNPASTDIPPSDSSGTVNFVVSELGMRNLRAGEYYFMWVKTSPDSGWKIKKQLLITYTSPEDTAIMVGTIKNISIENIYGVLVTIERTSNPATPGFSFLQANDFEVDPIKRTSRAALNHSQTLGDYSALQGSLVFTSKSSDSLSYTHEFYLMNYAGGIQTPSLMSLTAPPTGWDYGLWAEDTNFTPHEYFFYGFFSKSIGHDSDSSKDSYFFPGGWKPQQMNMPGGSIIVTLEPQLYGDSLKFKGPSPFTVLSFNRIRFIDKDHNYPMNNVSANGLPSGAIIFRKN